jgi:hypothetical protein
MSGKITTAEKELFGHSKMAPRHTALMSYAIIWMKHLATDGFDMESQEPGPPAPLTRLHWISFSGGTCRAWCTRLPWRRNIILWQELQ